MSTYLNQQKGSNLDVRSLDAPLYLRDFLNEQRVIQNLSQRTVLSYYLNIRQFLRWLTLAKTSTRITKDSLEDISIADVPIEEVQKVTSFDIRDFLMFSDTVLENTPSTRSLKLTALKQFFHYLHSVRKDIKEDPTLDIKQPRREKRTPKYLTLEESQRLLDSIAGDMPERDYCMVLIFLTCGLRLSELVGINLSDIRDNTILVYGKGRKERVVYLSDVCLSALHGYLIVRSGLPKIIDKDALFLSRRTGRRLTGRRVEQILDKMFFDAGLDGKGYSVHKLRHTTASMMIQNDVNLLVIKELLGHESVSTTQIYAHIAEGAVQQAVQESPISKLE